MIIDVNNRKHMDRMMEFLALPKKPFLSVEDIAIMDAIAAVEIETPEEQRTCNTCDNAYKLKNKVNQQAIICRRKCQSCKRGVHNGRSDNWVLVVEDMGPVCSVCVDQKSGLRFHPLTGYVCEHCYVTVRRCRCGSKQPVVKHSDYTQCGECYITSGSWKTLIKQEAADRAGTSCALNWDCHE